MAERGIKSTEAWWIDGWMGGMLVMSAFTLCPFLTCDSISSNYHTWIRNCGERASAAYENTSHMQRGYMRAHANRNCRISIRYPQRHAGPVWDVASVCAPGTRPQRDTDLHSPSVFNSEAWILVSRCNKARILNGTLLKCFRNQTVETPTSLLEYTSPWWE